MIEFDKVTTRGGDWGESSLASGERRRKDDLLFEMMGAIDELSSFLGLARASCGAASTSGSASGSGELSEPIAAIQRNLLAIGAQVATPMSDPNYPKLRLVGDGDVEALETMEGRYLSQAEIGDQFILPGGSLLSGQLDVARAMCRRAERRIVTCIRDRSMSELIPSQRYLNRLSDLLFILARYVDTKERGATQGGRSEKESKDER